MVARKGKALMLIDAVVNQRWFPALPTSAMKEFAEAQIQPYSDSEPLRNIARSAVPFSIHNIAHHFFEGHKDRFWDVEDFPRPVPPFKECWFEWGAPKFLLEDCKFEKMGCLVIRVPGLSKGNAYGSIPFIQRAGGDIGTWPMFVWATGDGGELVEIDGLREDARTKTGACVFAGDYYSKLSDDHKDSLTYLSERMTHPVLFSLSLLHCKNVVQRDAVQDPALVKARARRGLWSRSGFKVIEIRPMGRRSHGSAKEQSVGRRTTIRRGHFKNYKEGAGLFGKLHGLYWWDQFIEGDPDQAAYKFNRSMVPSLSLVSQNE